MSHAKESSLWDHTWKDQDGDYVIYQTPNKWLIGWAVLTVVSLLLNGTPANIISGIATVLLAIWAALEIKDGINYFRRGLGVIVLIFVVMNIVRALN